MPFMQNLKMSNLISGLGGIVSRKSKRSCERVRVSNFYGGIKKKNTPKIEEEETFAFTRRSLSPSGAATAGTAAPLRDETNHVAKMY